MKAAKVMRWLKDHKPWMFERGSAGLQYHEVEKIVAVLEAIRYLEAEEQDRIHAQCMDDIHDHYGDS